MSRNNCTLLQIPRIDKKETVHTNTQSVAIKFSSLLGLNMANILCLIGKAPRDFQNGKKSQAIQAFAHQGSGIPLDLSCGCAGSQL